MTRDERLRNKGAAERLLEKMNDMIRGQSYAKMVKEGGLTSCTVRSSVLDGWCLPSR